MKKVLAIVLALAMVFAFAACGKKETPSNEPKVDHSNDGKKIAYVLTEVGDTYSLGLGSNFAKAFKAAGGEVIEESFPKDTSDFSSYIQNAVNNMADVIFCPNSIQVASLFIGQAADKMVDIPIMAGDTWESSVILEATDGTGLDVYCSTFFDENDESGAAKDFVKGFKAYLNSNAQEKTNNGGNDIVAAVSALGFDAYNVAFDAVERALAANGAKATSIDVANALWGTDIKNAVTGTIKFDQVGDAIKDSAYIKKAASKTEFAFEKVQTVANNAAQGKALDYSAVPASKTVIAADGKIYIGVYEPQSGANGAGGKQEVIGAKYANSLKNSITVDGKAYPVELVIVDNESDDTKAVSAASQIVNKGACVSIGSYGSGISIAAADTFYNAGVPAIGVSCTNPLVTDGHPLYFRICFLDPFQGSVMADFAMTKIK
ncbi:MAG: ABC transporter substrate-binding protein [Clostridia bacterium]|nr:ABC transporter substrate-binding protein [Clostridia bacterium]